MKKKVLFAAAAFAFCLTPSLLPEGGVRAQQLASNAAPNRNATGAPAVYPLKRMALRVGETAEGSSVVISSDAPFEGYRARTEGDRFIVLIEQADASSLALDGVNGRGFARVGVGQQGRDTLLLFTLRPGFRGSARANFNRLEIVFSSSTQQPQQPQPQSGSGNSDASADSAPKPSPTPVPTPSPAPSPNTAAPGTAGTTNPLETNAPGATEAAKATAAPAGTAAARLAALLTPEKKAAAAIKKLDKPPVIDGKLGEGEWSSATVFKDFVQYRPVDLVAPTKQTEVHIGYDAKFLYVAFHAFDEPDKVRATVAKRDNVFNDDWVGIWLDTFNDGRRAYELIFNPLGVQADAIFTEGISEDFSVDIVHESKGSVTSDGYVVEVAIPFKSLRYVAGKDKQWGLHLLRTIKRLNNEQSSWMPISKDNSSLLGQGGHITGLEGISAERTLELIPSLTISEEGKRINRPVPGAPPAPLGATTNDRFLNKPIEFDPGLTAKFTVTPQITLDFAYNPDFAQVEADATVITANQRFPIFFEEKRPFFLEGKEIFETLISAVHTRTIVDPDYAVKLTGKQGRNTFGILLASDNAPGNLDDDDRDFVKRTLNSTDPGEIAERDKLLTFLDKNATIGVLRLKRDIGKEHHIGFLGTTYNFTDKYNHTSGVDARFRLNKTTTVWGQVLGSISNQAFFYADEGVQEDRQEKGVAYAVYLNSSGRNFGYEIGSVGRSKFFRADVGFNRRFNTNNPTLFVRYQTNDKPKQKIIYYRVYNFTGSNFDWEGRHQRWVNESQLQLRLQRQTWVGLGYERGYERVFEDEFGSTRDARRRVVASIVGEERAAGLAPCDAFGNLPPLVEDDPATPDINERRNHPRCTFFGLDDERSVDRNTVYFYVDSAPSKKFTGFFFTSINRGVIDFDFGTGNPRFPRVSPSALLLGPGAPRDPGASNEWFFEGNVSYQPTNELRLQLFYTKDRLTRRDTGRVAFDDNIYSLRGTYQFTRFWFARARADYTTLGSRVRMQYLLGWTPNPGTSFYVGYNDDMNRNGVNPFNGDLEPGFRRNGRLFFIKAAYLIRRSFGN